MFLSLVAGEEKRAIEVMGRGKYLSEQCSTTLDAPESKQYQKRSEGHPKKKGYAKREFTVFFILFRNNLNM